MLPIIVGKGNKIHTPPG